MPRSKTEVPRDRLSLQQVSEATGLSYSRIYVLVSTGVVPGKRDTSGMWTIADRDVNKFKRRERADTNRKAVMLRPGLARYAAWARAAGGKPVSSWLAGLADAASGYEE